jgi:hypothetical protein
MPEQVYAKPLIVATLLGYYSFSSSRPEIYLFVEDMTKTAIRI